jgi:hypothetical protein
VQLKEMPKIYKKKTPIAPRCHMPEVPKRRPSNPYKLVLYIERAIMDGRLPVKELKQLKVLTTHFLWFSHCLVQKFCTKGLNYGSGWRTPLLMLAAECDNEETVKWLLAHGADIDARDSFGDTTYLWALYMNDPEVAAFCVFMGADVTVKNKKGQGAAELKWIPSR